jgi:hypothetical protein
LSRFFSWSIRSFIFSERAGLEPRFLGAGVARVGVGRLAPGVATWQ